MKRMEQNRLLKEIIGGDELSTFRRSSLEHTLTEIKRHSRHRRIMRACALAGLPLLLILGVVLLGRQSQNGHLPSASSRRAETTAVRFITDEELFALFPGRPLALVGKPGHQQLVFLDQPAATEQ